MDKKMIVWGYWNKNLGDDLFLSSLIEITNNSQWQIVISCPKRHASYYKSLGVKVLCNDTLLYRGFYKFLIAPLELISKDNYFILLGGSLFPERNEVLNSRKLKNLNYAISRSRESDMYPESWTHIYELG